MDSLLFALLAVFTVSHSYAAQVEIHRCNFEPSGTCTGYVSSDYTYSGITRPDWQSRTGRTPSGAFQPGTGPQTGAQEGAYYMYFEASQRNAADVKNSGTLTSGLITPTAGRQFSKFTVQFYHYEWGQTLGILDLNILNSDGSIYQTLQVADGINPVAAWVLTRFEFDPPASSSFRIQFVGSTNNNGEFSSDYAVDNIMVEGTTMTCADSPCDANAVCVDTTNSFQCNCNSGYQLRSGSTVMCEDINECTAGTPCHENADCANTAGSYSCTCKSGFSVQSGTGQNIVCIAVGTACNAITCPANSNCINSGNTYMCQCQQGYRQVGTQLSTVCYRNGGLSAWTDSTECTKSCEGGQKNQTRTCTNPTPEPNGLGCDPEQATSQTVDCNTHACPVGCFYQKPCECNTDVTKYATGSEPDMTLSHFTGVTPSDLTTALAYLDAWNRTRVAELRNMARCDQTTLMGHINNLNTNVQSLVGIDSALKSAQAHMRAVIDCNSNEEIEVNLWTIYDFLCERSIAINQVKMDLMSKKTMLDAEKMRCGNRSMITSMLEMWQGKNY